LLLLLLPPPLLLLLLLQIPAQLLMGSMNLPLSDHSLSTTHHHKHHTTCCCRACCCRRSPHTTQPAQLLAMKQQLQDGSHFGFVGLEMMFDNHLNYPRIGLHSCHGLFWGCIPDDAPALLMHTGHKRTHLAWIQHRMLAALQRWISLSQEHTVGVIDMTHVTSTSAVALRIGHGSSSSSSSSYSTAEHESANWQQPQELSSAAGDYDVDNSYVINDDDDDGGYDLVPIAAEDDIAGSSSSNCGRQGVAAAASSNAAAEAAADSMLEAGSAATAGGWEQR
jgi:hypothetical protein